MNQTMNMGQLLSACCQAILEMSTEGWDPYELKVLVKAMDASMAKAMHYAGN